MRALLIALCSASLAACASMPTTYTPENGTGRGYSEQRIESDRFRVHFDAGPDMSRREAEDLALRRAAELTLEEGADWFLVVGRFTEGDDRDPVRVGGGVGVGFGSGGYRSRNVGVGIQIDPSAGEKRATLEILIRSGEIDEDPNAYNAYQVLGYAERED